MLAAPVYLKLELESVAFVERRHAGALDRRDVHKRVRLAVVALDETEALHGVEELDRAAGLLASQRALRRGRCPLDRHRLTIDAQVGRGDFAAAIDKRELERL